MVNGLIGRVQFDAPKSECPLILFAFRAGKKPQAGKGEFFVPLSSSQFRAVAKAEEELALTHSAPTVGLAKDELRGAWLDVFVKDKKLKWRGFYPHGKTKLQGDEPTGKKIGAKIHAAITSYLLKKFPGYSISHPAKPSISDKRIGHLQAMEIDYTKEYPIEEYARLSEAYLGRKRQT